MDFLKTGFNLVETNEMVLDQKTLDMISSLMTLFIEDVTRTACIYVMTNKRKEITARDMKKSLMYQAQNFFNQDDTLESRYLMMMQELAEEEEEGEEEEESEEDGEEEYEGNEEPDPELVSKVDQSELKWNEWNPTDPILGIVKRSIDKIEIEEDD
jgi:hypothetical protein